MRTTWPEVSLGDVCELKYGKSLPAGRRSGDGFGVFGSNGRVGLHETPLTVGSTIVVGRKGSFGEVHYSDDRCWPIDTTYYVDETSTKANLRWLYYRMKSLPLDRLNRAAAIPGLNRDDAYAQRVLLPPIEEQRRIAAVLDAADALRAKRRQAIAKLRDIDRAAFAEMFMGGTETVRLSDLLEDADLFRDGDWVETKDQDPDGGVRLTQLADIGVGSWLDRSSRFMTESAASRLRCTYLEKGDVLVARMPDPIGRACIFPGSDIPCVTAVDVCIIRPDNSTTEPRWLVAALNHPAIRVQVERLATGTTRSRVSRRNLGQAVLPAAPIESQREFAAVSTANDVARDRLQRHATQLDDLFASLQQRAFRGEL